MSETPKKPASKRPKGRRVWSAVKRLLRTRISAGLIVILPLYVTILLVRFVFELMRDSSRWLVDAILLGHWVPYLPESWNVRWEGFTREELSGPAVGWTLAIFSVFLTIFLLYAIGVFTANIIGSRAISAFEALVDRVPLVKTVYRASKQILVTFTKEDGTAFQRVALLPFPSKDVRSLGFITATSREELTGEELVTCFLASTPNPTTGFIFVLRKSEVVELDWTVEEAVRVIMSGGILAPETIRMRPKTDAVVGVPSSRPPTPRESGVSPRTHS